MARTLPRLVFRFGRALPLIGKVRVFAVTGCEWNRGVARRVGVRIVPGMGVDPENFPRRAEREEDREKDCEGFSRLAPSHRLMGT